MNKHQAPSTHHQIMTIVLITKIPNGQRLLVIACLARARNWVIGYYLDLGIW